jgi:predicted transcriptional regulator
VSAPTGEVVGGRLDVDSVVFDMSIYPRLQWSARTVERYSEALNAGETLPPIIVEVGTLRLLDGLHRLKAHQANELTEIEVEQHSVPEGVPATLYAASLSARHGDRMTGEDLKAVARQVVKASPEFSFSSVARMLGVSNQTVGRWCADISERERQLRQVRALLLVRSGMSQRQAAEHLGVTQGTVNSDFHAEIPNHLDELIAEVLDDLPAECAAVADDLSQELVVSKWSEEEQQMLDTLRSGVTVVANLHSHGDLVRWAEAHGAYERVDRKSKWGNPFVMPGDGDRERVVEAYATHYLPNKPSLLACIDDLRGKVLGCWCAPALCHGHVLAAEADK